ncbi:dicarboxylate/amino acid:cation symporter [Desulfovibrio falkowii]|uniref:dicarboxylate/amino acid:cation symporter n=1 Tax=Desulfovibrio sp. WGS1351 TaxID=3366814 RepID=UPI00372D517E
MLKYLKILYVQVLIAICIGILLGHFYPQLAVKMQPLGAGFIKLIKMVIAPLIFCTVVTGIAGMQDLKAVGKIGGLSLVYFMTMTTLALIIGMVVVNIAQPGVGMNIDVNTFDASAKGLADQYASKAKDQTLAAFLMNIIPSTFVSAFTSGEILQVLMIAILFAFALNFSGEKGQLVLDFVKSFSEALFKLINIIMRVAPVGAFGAMAFTIGKEGLGSVVSLGELILCFYLTSLLFVILVLGAVATYSGFNIFKFIRYIKEELLIVLGTSSSESVLPNMLYKMEKAGCQKSVVDLVIPTGYSFNLDGTAIYLTMAAIFLAQATNTALTTADQLTLLIILIISSKGAAAVTGGGFIVLAGSISSVSSIPPESLAIIFGIDRFMSEARALTNLVGNGVASITIAKITGKLDQEQLRRELDKVPGQTQTIVDEDMGESPADVRETSMTS